MRGGAMFDHELVKANGVILHAVSRGSGKTMLFLQKH